MFKTKTWKTAKTSSGSISRIEPNKLSSWVNGYLSIVLHFLQADTHFDIEGFLLLVSSSFLCVEIYGLCFLGLYSTEYKQYCLWVAFNIFHQFRQKKTASPPLIYSKIYNVHKLPLLFGFNLRLKPLFLVLHLR